MDSSNNSSKKSDCLLIFITFEKPSQDCTYPKERCTKDKTPCYFLLKVERFLFGFFAHLFVSSSTNLITSRACSNARSNSILTFLDIRPSRLSNIFVISGGISLMPRFALLIWCVSVHQFPWVEFPFSFSVLPFSVFQDGKFLSFNHITDGQQYHYDNSSNG